MQNRMVSMVGLLLLSNIGFTQQVMDLKACLAYAQDYNQEWKISLLNEELAQQEKRALTADLYPQISGAFENTYNGVLRTSILPGEAFGGEPGSSSEVQFGTAYESTITLRATQQLYNPALGSSLKIAEQNKLIKQVEGAQTLENIAYNIAMLYYNISLQERQQDNLRISLVTLEELLEQGRLQLVQGVARQIDVDRLQVNANSLKVQIEQSERTLSQLINSLKIQMGMNLAAPLKLAPLEIDTLGTQLAKSLRQADAFLQRPDLRLLNLQAEVNALQRRMNNQGYLPSLSLSLLAGSISNRNDLGFKNANWNDYLALTLNLEVPIFDGFRKKANHQQWKTEASILEQRQILTRQQATYELDNASDQLANTLRNLQQQAENEALAAKVFAVTQLEFQEGIADATTLTEARNDLTEAQNTYSQTLLELLQAKLEVAYAQGNLVNYINQQ